jgi:iron(III) transport system ATP-binding protein
VAVLRNGRIAQVGAPREIYANPVDAELAAFLGESNLVEAEVHGSTAITALGRLDAPAHTTAGPAVALVRPEQIVISEGFHRDGLAGRVTKQIFQGHESMISVIPDRECGCPVILVRVNGPAAFSIGCQVTLTASGAATIWPRVAATT